MRLQAALGAFIVVALTPVYPGAAQEATCNGKSATVTDGRGTDGDDVLIGTEGNDDLNAGQGNDTICGLGGDDQLSGFLGDDYIDGGPGSDRLYGCDPSHGKSDAVVCFTYGPNSPTDADTMLGGEGDDHLFGHLSNDSIDGGSGFDVVDGGESTDSCMGERYARCETMDPPEPQPACMDGVDNDGDGYVDAAGDPECSRERDPTEDIANDPVCYNGNDDDDDGSRDYPEDIGCNDLSGDDEFNCALCPPNRITIEYERRAGAFEGFLFDRPACVDDRPIRLRKVVRRGRVTVGNGAAEVRDGEGHWTIDKPNAHGRFLVVAPRTTYMTESGDEPVCDRRRSAIISVS